MKSTDPVVMTFGPTSQVLWTTSLQQTVWATPVTSTKISDTIMPTCSSDGVPFTNFQQLLDVWQDFLGRKLSCEDLPGAAFAPEQPVEDDENTVSFQEFEECVNGIRKGKTLGLDDSPIEVYLASPHAKQELYEIVCILWRKD